MRRMIDPQTIIKSQIADDKEVVDLYELLEKYGTKFDHGGKSVTLQFYSKETADDGSLMIVTDTDVKGIVAINTAITISEYEGDVIISGLLFNISYTNFIEYIEISDGDYENGIVLQSTYEFDVHVIKV